MICQQGLQSLKDHPMSLFCVNRGFSYCFQGLDTFQITKIIGRDLLSWYVLGLLPAEKHIFPKIQFPHENLFTLLISFSR